MLLVAIFGFLKTLSSTLSYYECHYFGFNLDQEKLVFVRKQNWDVQVVEMIYYLQLFCNWLHLMRSTS